MHTSLQEVCESMANILKVSMQETIIELLERGWSQRRVARELQACQHTIMLVVPLHW
jgi:DNA-binding NarL/FixJ family response regulator